MPQPSTGAGFHDQLVGAGLPAGASAGQPAWTIDSIAAGRKAMADFLATARAYDILPDSNKVIVFDTAVTVRLAFYALVEHDTVCAPLWDSERCAFAGMLTTSDIVDIMRVFYTPGSGAPASAALSDLTIAAWREFAGSKAGLSRGLSAPDFRKASTAAVRSATDDARAGGGGDVRMRGASPVNVPPARRTRARLIAIDPEDDLLTVSIKLSKHRIHHLPVLDVEQSAVIAILSHRHLLQFVAARFADARRLFDVPLYVLGVGSFEDVVVVPTSASVISVLNVLAERHISAVPLVNEAGQVVDVYCRDDVTFVAHDPTLMVLDAPVGEVRRAQVTMMGPSAPLVTCDRMDSLHRALELFGATAGRCERLVCVDEHRRCTGVVSLSDVFAFFCSRAPLALRPVDAWSGGPADAGQSVGLALDFAESHGAAMEL